MKGQVASIFVGAVVGVDEGVERSIVGRSIVGQLDLLTGSIVEGLVGGGVLGQFGLVEEGREGLRGGAVVVATIVCEGKEVDDRSITAVVTRIVSYMATTTGPPGLTPHQFAALDPLEPEGWQQWQQWHRLR